MNKRLSIVIPVYNLEKYIGKCLDSCINQDIDFDQYEILCIDDGSKDKSLSIMKEYEKKYKNIKVISKKNSGVSDTRNVGIDLATGKYIWFIDGDDEIRSNCIKQLLKKIEKDELDLLMLSSKTVKENFKVKNEKTKDLKFKEVIKGIENVFFTFPSKSSGAFVFNYIIKKEILDLNNIKFKKEMCYGEDTLFVNTLRLYCNSTIVVDEIIYLYRQRPGSAMNSKCIESKIKHLQSIKILIKEYKQQLKSINLPNSINERIKLKISHATQGVLFDLLYMDKKTVYETIKELKELDVYPYKLRFENLKVNKNIKHNIINYSTFLFPCEIYFKLFYRITSKMIQKNYIKEK